MNSRASIRIRFVGDISFNDAYARALESGENPFEEVIPVLNDADLVVGNLECLAEGTAQNLLKKPRISTTLKALDTLKRLNLGLVSLATNHYYDNLEDGFDATINRLNDLEIAHVGATRNKDSIYQPYIYEEKGWRIGFLNYVHSDTNPKVPTGAKVYANLFEMDKLIGHIKELKSKVDRVVMLLHWGGKSDYGYFPHKEQIGQAKQMVDAGADAVIGHHSHTFQSQFQYKGRPVVFSLGNFCFADIHSDGDIYRVRESGKKGAIVELEFSENEEIKKQLFPFRINDLKLIPDEGLKTEYANWQRLFSLVRSVPGMYSFYYYMLRRWEPVHYHAQLQNTTITGLAFNKLKRIFGFK